jgi:hypothetical protein
MPDIELPDGTIACFPDAMEDAAIAAVLRKQFAPAAAPEPKPVGPSQEQNRSPRARSLEPEVEWAPEVIRSDERPFPDRRPPRVLLQRPRSREKNQI